MHKDRVIYSLGGNKKLVPDIIIINIIKYLKLLTTLKSHGEITMSISHARVITKSYNKHQRSNLIIYQNYQTIARFDSLLSFISQ